MIASGDLVSSDCRTSWDLSSCCAGPRWFPSPQCGLGAAMSAKRYDVVGLRAVLCALPRLDTLWRVTVRALATYCCYPAWLLRTMGRRVRAEAQRWAGVVGPGHQTELFEVTPRPPGRSVRWLGHQLRRLVPLRCFGATRAAVRDWPAQRCDKGQQCGGCGAPPDLRAPG